MRPARTWTTENGAVRSACPDSAELDVQLAEVLAAAKGVTPAELDVRLYDHVDPDALERLRTQASVEWTFEFAVDGVALTVRSDGSVSGELRDAETAADADAAADGE